MGDRAKWSASAVTLSDKQLRGKFAEDAAATYLVAAGLKLLQRNFLCSFGEIDLIMQDQNQLIFVEVRYRKSSLYGSGAETVTWQKQQKLIRTALFYLQGRKQALDDISCRFDVIDISPHVQKNMEIVWIKDAFQVQA